jgi:hypothetical protein
MISAMEPAAGGARIEGHGEPIIPIHVRPAEPADFSFVETTFFDTQRWIIEALFGWRGDAVERAKFAVSFHQASAARLYERLGFTAIGSDEYKVYFEFRV